ncbi:MAG: CRISPR-associated endonuclease Cas1 [Deltaproteobacteria bacterium]|nr:CRISPR-associated endonuclease Cas1 [Deltaproteobacteria bacterium]
MQKRINLFITEQESTIGVEGNRIYIRKDKSNLLDIPIINIRQIVLFGNISITPRAITRLLNDGVNITYLTSGGKYIGQILSAEHPNSDILRLQIKRSEETRFRYAVSQAIIEAKIKNSIAHLLQRRRIRTEINQKINELKINLKKIHSCTDIKELLGIEGISAKAYFQGMKELLINDFGFNGRSKHPPEDPVNAALSLSYTMLYSIIFSMLHINGLNPYIGFLHDTKYGHAALASDLLEEFRAFVCDRFVIRCFNQSMFAADSFTVTANGVFFKEDALKLFLKNWAINLDTEINYNNSFKTNIYRLVEIQTEQLRKSILNGETYKPYIFEENIE